MAVAHSKPEEAGCDGLVDWFGGAYSVAKHSDANRVVNGGSDRFGANLGYSYSSYIPCSMGSRLELLRVSQPSNSIKMNYDIQWILIENI